MKKSRFRSIVKTFVMLGIGLLLAGWLVTAQQVSIVPHEITVAADGASMLEVQVSGLTNGVKYLSVELSLCLDGAVDIVSVRGGNLTTDEGGPLIALTRDSDISANGKSVLLVVTELLGGPFAGSSGTVYRVTIHGKSVGETPCSINLSVNTAQDQDGNNITLATRGGVVIVSEGEMGETVTHHYCEGWQMLSIPVCCDPNDTAAVIGDDVANPFLWRWNAAEGAYLLADEVNPTWGYWLLIPEGGVDIDATGIEPQSDVAVSVSPVGWHQISAPWPYEVDDIHVHRGTQVKSWNEAVSVGWMADVTWGYDGAEYALASRIAPWSGYWVLPLVDGLTLEFSRSSAYPAGTAVYGLEIASVTPLSSPPPLPGEELGSIGILRAINIPNPIRDLNTTTFKVQGIRQEEIDKVRVEIFDLSGHLVYSEECSAVSIEWHTQNNLGEPLANGAYLYRVWALIDGKWQQSEFEKLAICR
jgi:hypothetical protein